ncbi:MAG: SEC-C domain-containing protein [Acidobacteria bacterium]|nr:SEC-C domain-containing protein [Acidobacteriota bacterium]
MARLGTEKRSAIVRVQTEERMHEIASVFEEHGWKFIIGIEPDEPEDITDLERLLNPANFQITVTKINRNEPCPCGSGKKYKKCCLGKQEHEEVDDLDALMQEGYSLSEKIKTVEACKIWIEVWNKLKSRFSPDMKSIRDSERIFNGIQSLFNWCQDLEMELGNAAIKNNSFNKKRIEYCTEFISFFPETNSLILHNMKRAIAESYFGMGDHSKGDEAFLKLVEEYPENIWGYIGWGDMYFMPLNKMDTPNYQRAEQIYGMALHKNIEDKDALLERLDHLEEAKKKSPDK